MQTLNRVRRGREAAATHSPFIFNITPFFDIVKGNLQHSVILNTIGKKPKQKHPAAKALQEEKLQKYVAHSDLCVKGQDQRQRRP